MADVYEKSWLTIAATGFVDGSSGLFANRVPSRLIPELVNADLGHFFQHERDAVNNDQYYVLPRNIWDEGVLDAPLNRRAWVLQERYMSRRVLHFGEKQIFWECKELEACEIFPSGVPEIVSLHPFKTPFAKTKNIDEMSSRDQVYEMHWNPALVSYTEAKLTFGRDKLVAISGVVKKLRKQTGDRYFAGLWEGPFLHQLLWFTSHVASEDLQRRSNDYRAPSWSWASIDERVRLSSSSRDGSGMLLAKLLDVNTVPRTSDDTGQVIGGYAQIRGPLITASFDRNCFDGGQRWKGKSLLLGDDYIETEVTFDAEINTYPCLADIQSTADPALRLDFFCLAIEVDAVALKGLVLQATGQVHGQ